MAGEHQEEVLNQVMEVVKHQPELMGALEPEEVLLPAEITINMVPVVEVVAGTEAELLVVIVIVLTIVVITEEVLDMYTHLVQPLIIQVV